jgi:tetratricopeptide (TPR) repeat protein
MATYAQNTSFRGKVVLLNSKGTPVSGIKISGKIYNGVACTPVYTKINGGFELKFPPTVKVGSALKLEVGTTNGKEHELEIVNDKELEIAHIPKQSNEIFTIVLCKKGQRDQAAERYYKIIKSSSDRELSKMQQKLDNLLDQQEKDYKQIQYFFGRIDELKERTDSITIYQEALRIASINKDDASERVLEYIKLLDSGAPIQEARKALDIQKATAQMDRGIDLFEAAVEELETRASASKAIFDYENAIECYDTVIFHLKLMNINKVRLTKFYFHIAENFQGNGEYHKALIYEQKIVAIRKKHGKHLSLANAQNNIAITYFYLGNYQKSIEFHKKAANIFELFLGSQHPNVALSYHNIASTYHELGLYEKALEFNKKAIDIRNKTLDKKHPEIAKSYSNIALTYESLGHYSKSLEFYNKSLTIFEDILVSKHPDLAITYNRIAISNWNLGFNEKAIEFNKKAIEIQEEILISNHPELASSYNNIARIYQGIDKHQIALQFQKKAIDISLKIFDKRHPNLAITYLNIGTIYKNLNNYRQAFEFETKGINILEKVLNKKHPKLAIAYNNIAKTHRELGNYNEALNYQKKAIAIFKEIQPLKHPYQKGFLNNLIKLYFKRGQHHFLQKNYKTALLDFDTINIHSPNNSTWNYIGLCHYHLKNYSQAIDAYQEVLEPNEAFKKEDYYNNLGMAYVKSQQFDKANTAFMEYQKLHPKESNVHRNWVMYHALQNQKDKAITALQKAIKLGYNDLNFLENDDSLDNIRKKRAFKKLIRQVKKQHKE